MMENYTLLEIMNMDNWDARWKTRAIWNQNW